MTDVADPLYLNLLGETALNRYAALRALGMGAVRASGETHKLLASHFKEFSEEAHVEALRKLTDDFDHAAAELEKQLSVQ